MLAQDLACLRAATRAWCLDEGGREGGTGVGGREGQGEGGRDGGTLFHAPLAT